MSDTVKMVNSIGVIERTLPRECLWRVQTPQTFRFSLIKKAYAKVLKDKFYGTDDAQLVERMNKPVKVISGDYRNIKITYPYDKYIFDWLLGITQHEVPCG